MRFSTPYIGEGDAVDGAVPGTNLVADEGQRRVQARQGVSAEVESIPERVEVVDHHLCGSE